MNLTARPNYRWFRRRPTGTPTRPAYFSHWAAAGGIVRRSLTMSSLVRRENNGGVATLTLNRPEKLNALSKDMFEELDVHVDAIARERKKVGLVVLRGSGGHFSAGYDMSEVLEHVKAHAKPHFHSEVIQKVANLPQPVISAVQGHCSTGAMELALAGDLIVGAAAAQVSGPYSRL